MSTPLPEGGATINPHAETQLDQCIPEAGDGRRYIHHWVWQWDHLVWKDVRRCTICGKTEECKQ